MIKEFFYKKENIFIIGVFIVSLFFIVLGFLLLFLKTDPLSSNKVIPNSLVDIVWATYKSKEFDLKIEYPEYMSVFEQKENNGVGINITEFPSREFLTYFSNQNQISFYPEGIDNQLFYGKTKEGEYTSSTGQSYKKIEYFTSSNTVWAVMLIPKTLPKGWYSNGFIWIQTTVKNKKNLCIKNNIIIEQEFCDPYLGELPMYKGEVSGQFIRQGYEVINKNLF